MILINKFSSKHLFFVVGFIDNWQVLFDRYYFKIWRRKRKTIHTIWTTEWATTLFLPYNKV